MKLNLEDSNGNPFQPMDLESDPAEGDLKFNLEKFESEVLMESNTQLDDRVQKMIQMNSKPKYDGSMITAEKKEAMISESKGLLVLKILTLVFI